MFPSRLALALLLVTSLTPLSFARDNVDKWVVVHSEHFGVLTNAGRDKGTEICLRFERMRASFGQLFQKSKVSIPVPLNIVAFKSHDELTPYAPLFNGKPVSVSGFFQSADDQNFIGLDASTNEGLDTVFHEYSHVLIDGNFPQTPLWFDEGVAEYLSTLKFTESQVVFGEYPDWVVPVLNRFDWLKLPELLAVQHDSATYNDKDQRSIFYAESWLLVNYLIANDKLANALQYLHLTQIENQPIESSFQQAFGVPPAQMEAALRAYLPTRGKLYKAAAPKYSEPPYSVKELLPLQVRIMLADMKAHSHDHQAEATAEFQQILKEDPGNLQANRDLGYLYLQKGDLEKASAYLDHSVVEDSVDAEAYYLRGLVIFQQARQGDIPEAKYAQMRHDLQKAIELAPGMADAYNLLAFAFGAANKADDAVRTELEAVRLNPSNQLYIANLASFYMQAQQFDQANALFDQLKNSGNKEIAQKAQERAQQMAARQEQIRILQKTNTRPMKDMTDPRWKPTPEMAAKQQQELSASQTDVPPDTRKTEYVSGRIVAIDCSQPPLAIVTLSTGKRTMRLRIADTKNLTLIGEDSFSCGWRGRKALVNYKAGGKADGDVVSLELN